MFSSLVNGTAWQVSDTSSRSYIAMVKIFITVDKDHKVATIARDRRTVNQRLNLNGYLTAKTRSTDIAVRVKTDATALIHMKRFEYMIRQYIRAAQSGGSE